MFTKQLRVLATLANADGNIDETELKLMEKIGKAHDMSIDEIHHAINSPEKVEELSELDDNQRFELLYSKVQLMKIDNKIFNEEILYCQEIAMKLGYPFEAIMEIYPHVNTRINLSVPGEKAALKRKLDKILNQ